MLIFQNVILFYVNKLLFILINKYLTETKTLIIDLCYRL